MGQLFRKEKAIIQNLDTTNASEEELEKVMNELKSIALRKHELEKIIFGKRTESDETLLRHHSVPAIQSFSELKAKNAQRFQRLKVEAEIPKMGSKKEEDGLIVAIDYVSSLNRVYNNAFVRVKVFYNTRELVGQGFDTPILEITKNNDKLPSQAGDSLNNLFEKENELTSNTQAGLAHPTLPFPNDYTASVHASKIIQGISTPELEFLSSQEQIEFAQNQIRINSFLLFTLHVDAEIDIEDPHEFKLLQNLPDEFPELPFFNESVIYGWTVLPLYHKNTFNFGKWLLPLFKTPLPSNIQYEAIRERHRMLMYGRLMIGIQPRYHQFEDEFGAFDENFKSLLYKTPPELRISERYGVLDEYSEMRLKVRNARMEKYLEAKHRKKIKESLDARKRALQRLIKKKAEQMRARKIDALVKTKTRKHEQEVDELRVLIEQMEQQIKDQFMNDIKRKQEYDDELANIRKISSVRTGIRITFNKIERIATYQPIKIVFGLFVEAETQLDDFGMQCVYESSKIVEHLPDKELRSSQPPLISLVLENETYEIVRNVKALALLMKHKKTIYLGIQVLLMPEDVKLQGVLADDQQLRQHLEMEGVEEHLKKQLEDIEKQKLRLSALAQMDLHSWNMFKLTTNKGKIRKGTFGVPMNTPPLLKPPYVADSGLPFTDTRLIFTIELFDYEANSLSWIWERMQMNEKKKQKMKRVKEETYDYNPAPFIKNSDRMTHNKEFFKESGIDIYIDGARFLDETVGPTKVIVRVVDQQMNDFCSIYQAGISELDSDVYNPIYSFRQELRASCFDPTLMLLVYLVTWTNQEDIPSVSPFNPDQAPPPNLISPQILNKKQTFDFKKRQSVVASIKERHRMSKAFAIDPALVLNGLESQPRDVLTPLYNEISKGTVRLVGYSMLSLFINPFTQQMPSSRAENDFAILNNGLFQLPLYSSKQQFSFPLKKEDLFKSERLPCASLLVRIYEAPKTEDGTQILSITESPPEDWEKYGIWKPAVPYSSGLYNNETIDMLTFETENFEIRANRFDLLVKDFLKSLCIVPQSSKRESNTDKSDGLAKDKPNEEASAAEQEENDFLFKMMDDLLNLDHVSTIEDLSFLTVKPLEIPRLQPIKNSRLS